MIDNAGDAYISQQRLEWLCMGPRHAGSLVGTGIYLTCRTGWIQVRRFGYIMKSTVGSLFRKSEKDHGSNLSPFQGGDHSPGRDSGHGQHRRCHWRHLCGRARRCVLDVGCPPFLECVPSMPRSPYPSSTGRQMRAAPTGAAPCITSKRGWAGGGSPWLFCLPCLGASPLLGLEISPSPVKLPAP